MVVCPDCGKDVKEAKFCSNCGAVLIKAEEPVEEVVEEVVPMETGDVEETPSQDVVEEVVPMETEDVVKETPSQDVVEEVVPEEVIDEGETIEVKRASGGPDEEVINENKNSKFCPNCGTEITKDVAFCPQCGFKLEKDEAQTKFCQSCGKKININAEICPYCGVRVAGIVRSEEKNVLLAAILSFLFPGLGHLYNGLTKKGLSFIIAYIVSAVLMFILIGFVLMLIVWIWALVDAIKTTESINRGEFVEDKLF